jgi:3-oxoacyl-[acyl-carrier protein] reductase
VQIEGKVAVVTGAGSGIGRASAVALAERGADTVFLADVDEAGLADTAGLVSAAGSKPQPVRTDVADPASQRALFDEVLRVAGGLDILHNNAGVSSGDPLFPEMSLERIALVADVNLKGVLLGTQAALPLLMERGGGAIVNTASIAAHVVALGEAIYGTTKAAVLHFTKCCAELHGSHGIRVNCVLPGVVDTPMLKLSPWLEPLLVGVQLLAPSDVAAAVIELIEDDSAVAEARIVMNPGVDVEFPA